MLVGLDIPWRHVKYMHTVKQPMQQPVKLGIHTTFSTARSLQPALTAYRPTGCC